MRSICSARPARGPGIWLLERCRPKGPRYKSFPYFRYRIGTIITALLGFILAGGLLIQFVNTARAGTTLPTPQDEKPPAGNTQNGKKLFTSYGCFECHGHQAEGTSVGGPRLGPNPISFPAFSRYVRQPTGQMPPFTIKVTSDADLADIYAFLQSLPQPPKADTLPALK